MAKQLQRVQLGWTFQLGNGLSDDEIERGHKAHDKAFERIENEMKALASFARKPVNDQDDYAVENYELCEADVDDHEGVTVFPVWFQSHTEFTEQARKELEAFVSKVFAEVASADKLSCRLIAREEFREWTVSEKTKQVILGWLP